MAPQPARCSSLTTTKEQTVTDAMLTGVFMLVLGAAIGVILTILVRSGRAKTKDESVGRTASLANELTQLRDLLNSSTSGLEGQVKLLNLQMAEQARSDNQTARETSENLTARLATLEETARRIESTGVDLRNIFHNPRSRGSQGETLLEDMLKDVLPQDRFQRQYQLSNGRIVDFVVHLEGGLLPIDAKFPLEAWQRSLQGDDEQERTSARSENNKALVKNIRDIADRYILPGETMGFAFMYVPSESVFHSAIEDSSVMDSAREHQIFLVSPSTLWLYLQIIVMGFRGMRMAKDTRRILAELTIISRDLKGLQSDFSTLGSHLRNASNKYDDASGGLSKLSDNIERTSGRSDSHLDHDEGAAEPNDDPDNPLN